MLAKTLLLPERKRELRRAIESIQARATRRERGTDEKRYLVDDLKAIDEACGEALALLDEVERLEA